MSNLFQINVARKYIWCSIEHISTDSKHKQNFKYSAILFITLFRITIPAFNLALPAPFQLPLEDSPTAELLAVGQGQGHHLRRLGHLHHLGGHLQDQDLPCQPRPSLLLPMQTPCQEKKVSNVKVKANETVVLQRFITKLYQTNALLV